MAQHMLRLLTKTLLERAKALASALPCTVRVALCGFSTFLQTENKQKKYLNVSEASSRKDTKF